MKRIKKSWILIFLLFCLVSALKAQIVITPDDDSFVYNAGPKAAQAYGVILTDTLKTRKSVSSEEFTRETYVMFTIGHFDTTFSSVKVKLYGAVAELKRTQVFYSDTNWTEETLTGNNKPSGIYISDVLLQPGLGYFSWDVTNYINQAVSLGWTKVSFVFKDVAGSLSTKDTPWHSKENASGHAPLLELTKGPVPYHRNGNYYIDNIAGDDANQADSPLNPWKSLDRLNTEYFAPGDSVLFKCDGTWDGQLLIKGSGSPGKPIVVGSYESGNKPLINGGGLVTNTLQLSGQHHIEIQDLHLTNLGATADFRRGLYYLAEDMGPIEHIYIRRLEISDVNGSTAAGEVSKNNGGMVFEIGGTAKHTYFDTLVIEDCYIHDVDRTGWTNLSTWDTRTLTNDSDWVPSRNLIIRRNTFEQIGGNALIVRVATSPLMEHNLFTSCGTKTSGNASFSFDTDNALWQYNEACLTKFNSGDEDAGGFDSDYKSKNTILQYNYSHDNDYGGILLTGGPASSNGFNDGTIIRYNLFVNNRNHQIRTSGNATNATIYNNTIYNRKGQTGIVVIWHKSWEVFSNNTHYYNNIFHVTGLGCSIDLGGSGGNEFDYNLFYGSHIENTPVDLHKITLNPMLIAADSTGYASDTIKGYRLTQSSPAINSGKTVEGFNGTDIEGNQVPFYNIPDRGAFEYNGPIGINNLPPGASVSVYPNPVRDILHVCISGVPNGKVLIMIYSLTGSLMAEQNFWSVTGSMNATIPVKTLDLSPGYYLLKMSSGLDWKYETPLVIVK